MNQKVYQLLLDIKEVLADIFQSGIFSVHDSTITRLRDMASLSGQYGLGFAEKSLAELEQILEQQRHTMKESGGEAVPIFCKLNQYINICIKKAEYDSAKHNIIREEKIHEKGI